jgi:hypothetical protein
MIFSNASKIGTLHQGLALGSFISDALRSYRKLERSEILLARTRKLTLWAPLAVDAFVIVPDHRHFRQ